MPSPATIAQTAADALTLYRQAYETDGLVQSGWHEVAEDGRQLACALGVLGSEINSARDCPAQIMPRWLAQSVVSFFDGQDFADAKEWGLRFYAEIARLNGEVPFSVVHDWQANVVAPLAIEVAAKREKPAEPHETLRALHVRALAGDRAPRTEWFEALRPALYQVYRGKYAYADADANADAYAYAYAYANAYADADADAYADADADAYANADADADAYANAYARKAAWKRLADGMVECLARVPEPQSVEG